MRSESRSILGLRVDATSYEGASERVIGWAHEGRSAYVCLANVHMAMESFDSEPFRKVVNGADLVAPDGKPLAWALRLLGVKGASQVRGADLFEAVAGQAAAEGVPVGLYGSTPETLGGLRVALGERFPGLRIVCEISPPFRPLSEEEDEAHACEISASGARILFVGLGCPKQEGWMADHRGRVPAVMLGVGAAFDFHAGRVKQAPRWMQAGGIEWVYRLLSDPRRLWKRYLKHNPRFAAMFAAQALNLRTFDEKGSTHA